MITVVQTSAFASLQDLGRYGCRRYGIGHAGAMDALALRAGNLLLGNPEGTAALEVALGSVRLRFECDTAFCMTGALYAADLDGEPVHSYWRYTARKGQVLNMVRAVQGMYGYVCVRGGFAVPEIMGSRSTDHKAAFGGFCGRAVREGDCLPTGSDGLRMSRIGIAPIGFPHIIRAMPSAEYGLFGKTAHYRFWQDEWTLQSDSNRMGYRLSGPQLELRQPAEMLSHAVQFGTVQVPSSGQPIVLMADAQTTGGYPKIAAVAAADYGRLAQVRFGGKIRFQMVTPQEALALHGKNRAYLNQIKRIAENAS